MNEIKVLLIDFAGQYPISVPFIALIVYYIQNRKFRAKTNNLFSKMANTLNNKSILTHDLFFQENLFLSQIRRVRFKSSNKTTVFQIILEEKTKAGINEPKKILKDWKNIKKLHPSELKAVMYNILDKTKETYEKKILERLHFKWGEHIARSIYKTAYIDGFAVIYRPNIERLEKRIERLQNTGSKRTEEAFRSFLTKMQDTLDDAIFDCEEEMKQINGDIDKIINS